MSSVAIIDSGGANVASIGFAFERLGVAGRLTDDIAVLRSASHVILPGVGAAKGAMTQLRERKLLDAIAALTQPTLGICLGMQLLCDASEEGDTDCLGIVSGTVRRMSNVSVPVPHMGWNRVRASTSPLFAGIEEGAHFYFVHSFALATSPHTIATCDYAGPFAAAVAKDNFYGVQFHPERSSLAGEALLRNFLQL